MKSKEIIGVDVSKLFLDAHLHLAGGYKQFDNTSSGIRHLLSWVVHQSGVKKQALFFVFEHSGF